MLLEPLVFNDPVRGLLTVPKGFTSDLALARILREICRWAAAAAVLLDLLLPQWPWLATVAWMIAIGARAGGGLWDGRRHPAWLALFDRIAAGRSV